jgi:hypothetical protein
LEEISADDTDGKIEVGSDDAVVVTIVDAVVQSVFVDKATHWAFATLAFGHLDIMVPSCNALQVLVSTYFCGPVSGHVYDSLKPVLSLLQMVVNSCGCRGVTFGWSVAIMTLAYTRGTSGASEG